ncbi:MAG: ABC transporter ATP-binding protein [Stappiaceae bacterium]
MATINIKALKKSYGSLVVLKEMDIDVNDGELLVLVGPSGCGKSTLLSMIAGLDKTTSGHIFIGDNEVTRKHPRDRDIAMVFQSYALYPTMTVRQNISFGLEMRKVAKEAREQAIGDVAELLQIGELLDRKPSQLSGGQRQRVAMGRALVRRPEVFLLDEPLSNLDAKLRVEMRTEIKKLHARLGKTMIYVTHDQIEAMTLASRIAVMRDGEIQQLDVPRVVYDDPSNLFVAQFIGSPSMNFIPVRIERHDGATQMTLVPAPEQSVSLSAKLDYPQDGRDLICGVRPEDLRLVSDGYPAAHNEAVFSAVVDVIEPTGAEDLVALSIADVGINCKMRDASNLSPGDNIQIAVSEEKFRFFDPGSEMRIRFRENLIESSAA